MSATLRKPDGRSNPRPWTERELDRVRQVMWRWGGLAAVARELGRHEDVVQQQARALRAKARAHDLGEEEEDATAAAEEDDGKVETANTDRGQATPAALEADEESAI